MYRVPCALLVAALLVLPVTAVGQEAPQKPRRPQSVGVVPAATAPQWVWLSDKPADDQTVYFRKDVTLRGRVAGARLYVAADDEMTLYIDGREAMSHRGSQAPAFKDVTSLLASEGNRGGGGRHVLAVRARNNRGPAGLLVRLVFDGPGDSVAAVTDTSWRTSAKEEKGWHEVNFDDKAWSAAVAVGKLGDKPWAGVTEGALNALAKTRVPTATAAETLKVMKGFKAELLYTVPKETQGSWVNLCVDPKGRLIVSDQYGALYRVTPPPPGGRAEETRVEDIGAPIGEAQGLLWAFDSLYVVVNRGGKYESGLYRVRDTDGDDKLDKVEFLRGIQGGGGEHGPHAVLLAPDGQSLYVVCGNQSRMVQPLAGSLVPKLWGEDHLLPRMPDGNGFMRGVLGPGGCIYRVSPDGKDWVLTSTGYRNQYDAAFNRAGDLFTYDADMEWDMNAPWYRPTRVCFAASGAEFGWRNGAGKWPAYYPDSLPAAVDIGPGSPTGVCFGYGARFPAKYQEAFFICDWSYGKLYAVHLAPDGGGYKGEAEEFVTGTPLPLTDAVINPKDGAMYFAIGGRRTTSGLYRITYIGNESAAPVTAAAPLNELHLLRRRLEGFHGRQDPAAVESAWPHLGHPDRYVRFAARVAVEHQDPKAWGNHALSETDPARAIAALLALVRAAGKDPFHHPGRSVDLVLKYRALGALGRVNWDGLTPARRVDLLRVYAILFNRFGPPDPEARKQVLARLDRHFPAKSREVNAELCPLLVYLEAPDVVGRTLKLIAESPTQEEQMAFAMALRVLKTGWTAAQRTEYLSWFLKAAHFKGGNSMRGFVRMMREDAVATLTDKEKTELKTVLAARPEETPATAVKPRPLVKNYKTDDLVAAVEKGLKGRDFDRGRTLFGQAQCFACHRYDNEGGSFGPDLSGVAGRFSVRDLLESLVEPSKVISDQYAAVNIETSDGRAVSGRIINLNGDSIMVNTNMLDPNAITTVDRRRVEKMEPSKLSMMPNGLLDTFKEDEIMDLMAYLLSRGDRNSAMFKK